MGGLDEKGNEDGSPLVAGTGEDKTGPKVTGDDQHPSEKKDNQKTVSTNEIVALKITIEGKEIRGKQNLIASKCRGRKGKALGILRDLKTSSLGVIL